MDQPRGYKSTGVSAFSPVFLSRAGSRLSSDPRNAKFRSSFRLLADLGDRSDRLRDSLTLLYPVADYIMIRLLYRARHGMYARSYVPEIATVCGERRRGAIISRRYVMRS